MEGAGKSVRWKSYRAARRRRKRDTLKGDYFFCFYKVMWPFDNMHWGTIWHSCTMPFSCMFLSTLYLVPSCCTVSQLDELEEEYCKLPADKVTALAKNPKQLPLIAPKCSPFSGSIISAKLISSCVTNHSKRFIWNRVYKNYFLKE